eukprot:5728533-Pyramimonas_sp.AAC.1
MQPSKSDLEQLVQFCERTGNTVMLQQAQKELDKLKASSVSPQERADNAHMEITRLEKKLDKDLKSCARHGAEAVQPAGPAGVHSGRAREVRC